MEYKVNARQLVAFEVKSWIGRHFKSTKPLNVNQKIKYLNLGCGENYQEGYINADFFCHYRFWKKNTTKLEWQLDLRYPLDCNENYFDGVFTEHTLEHLYPNDAKNLLKELYRVLKTGGRIRITVPDLEKYVSFYNNYNDFSKFEAFHSRYSSRCSAIRNMTQNYFHLSVWDFDELRELLTSIGFSDIQRKSFSKTDDLKLNLDSLEREWETLYVEAIKG
jgi:predicted SAM-dependent methyltransferase